MKWNILIIWIIGGIIIMNNVLADAAINISLISPTPNNNTISLNTSFIINVTVNNASLLNYYMISLNNSNLTFISPQTAVWLSFNNNSFLNENLTTANNSATNGRCNITANVKPQSNGYFGWGMNFSTSGTNNFISCDSAPRMGLNGKTITVGAWARANDSMDSYGSVIDKGYSAGSPFITYALSRSFTNNRWFFQFSNGTASSSLRNVSDTSDYTPNIWYRVIGTYNGTHGCLYVNGTQKACRNAPGTMPFNASYHFVVGDSRTKAGSNVWTGMIDEVFVENRTWSDAEILLDYNSNIYKRNNTVWLGHHNISTVNNNNFTTTYSVSVNDSSSSFNYSTLRLYTNGVLSLYFNSSGWNVTNGTTDSSYSVSTLLWYNFQNLITINSVLFEIGNITGQRLNYTGFIIGNSSSNTVLSYQNTSCNNFCDSDFETSESIIVDIYKNYSCIIGMTNTSTLRFKNAFDLGGSPISLVDTNNSIPSSCIPNVMNCGINPLQFRFRTYTSGLNNVIVSECYNSTLWINNGLHNQSSALGVDGALFYESSVYYNNFTITNYTANINVTVAGIYNLTNIFFNTTNNYFNSTNPLKLLNITSMIIGGGDPCVYSGSGNWMIPLNSNCYIENKTYDILGNTVFVNGTFGNLTLQNVTLTNANYNSYCNIACVNSFVYWRNVFK